MSTATDVKTLPNYAGGEWFDSAGGETLEDRDPATAELVARVPLSVAADVERAVGAARAAQPAWRQVSPQDRARAVIALREVLVADRDELAALVTADMGKTLSDAQGEVGRGIESVESASASPHLLKGETLEGVARGVDVELVRQPVGVVAAITPFNFPAMIPLWFLPYAVACGNAFILKPSERDPRPSARIVELIDEHEIFPPGVVNLVHGGREAVQSILAHPGIDAISFVGQASTARLIATRSAETGKRVQALGGAKNSLIVAEDADLETTVPAIMGSAFGAAGQRCLAGSVCVIVGSEERRREVRDALRDAAGQLAVGSGADPRTDVCPMVAPEARERAEAMVADAEREGAEVVLDGRIGGGDAGSLLGPTLVEVSDPDSALAREEVFGPVLALIPVPDLEAAIRFANGSRYGNAGSIFTTSGAAARAYRWGIEAGMLGVNVGVPAPVAWFPFSGWKDSIDGDLHANGEDAVRFYTREKVVTSRW
ncbi:MAG TPA: CoA-acylating methylmalonate-semialdehyde dehydrogenase [Solirubrobacterales bacterium]|jgi:malonate-semialdehyde dehydrogenase (acetylating)/methylmalonate-semialdehyde dehydrogenase|nr:CoA-acylating methylmalonate-semialdehyde dehydrogenase [Solirubrobacterales bacterium]